MLRRQALCIRLFQAAIYRMAIGLAAVLIALPLSAPAQQASVSTWDAADFRIWGFIPYWSGQAGTSVVDQLNMMSASGTYNNVSDVIYFGGARPTSTGGIAYHSTAVASMTTLKNLSAQHGFDLHLSMFDTSGGTVDAVWTSIVNAPAYRTNFVNNVKSLLDTYEMDGFNFDWERPDTVQKWGNYTQLARELGDAIHPQGREISVCDYGYASALWDDSPLFDARVYDQMFIMGYHYPAFSSGNLDNEYFANTKLALDDQGIDNAFKDDQITIGIGTYGANGPATVTYRQFTTTNPNLPFDSNTISGTFPDINGTSRTGTWDIESRAQVREKTKLAIDRGMDGTFSWTLTFDARDKHSLHRVMHHYAVFLRGVPDLNLDGKVNASDANTLADNMGTVPGWKGTATAAQFDNFYMSGNWEKGDRDGNGFVNQADADWLAARYTTLGVNIPDRLAFTGEFENFANSRGLTGRWNAKRESGGNLRETGNYTQHGAGGLTWSGFGVGADRFNTHAVTIRNQNGAEDFDSLNRAPRSMSSDLASPIDTAQDEEKYVTFLVQQNTASLSASQLASNNRILSLDFLDSAGANQFDFAFRGAQHQFAIESQADATGQDVESGGFANNATYLFVGKIAGNGAAANTLQASLFQVASNVGNYASDDFEWMLTAEGSASFNPTITQLQFTSLYEGSFTVSNVWVGAAADLFALPSAAAGDFNVDGFVDMSDYLVWRKTMGQTGHQLSADANGNGQIDDDDYNSWLTNFGQVVGGADGESNAAVPETHGMILILTVISCASLCATRR